MTKDYIKRQFSNFYNEVIKGKISKSANTIIVGSNTTTETRVSGDLVVKGTDGTLRKIVFNQDGTCSWVTPS